jgi:electron transfer flavoprotein beta subunit
VITVAWKWVGDDERWAGVSESDRAALEVALRLAGPESFVTVVSAGPESVEVGLREAMAAGATRAVRVDAPAGLASAAVAHALAPVAAGSTWVLCGDASADRGTGSVPAFLAAELGAAQALGLVRVDETAAGGALSVTRRLDGGRREVLSVPSPAVLSVEGSVARLRRASLPAEVAARTATIEVVAGPQGPVEHAEIVRPYRPRARVLPVPSGDALERIRTLTGAETVGPASASETVVLEPPAAAERLLRALHEWGYVDAPGPGS